MRLVDAWSFPKLKKKNKKIWCRRNISFLEKMALNFGLFEEYLQQDNVEWAKGLVTPENVANKFDSGFGVVWHYCLYGKVDDPDIVYHFVAMGASLDVGNKNLISSSLHAAATNQKPRILKALLALGCPVDMIDKRCLTPLCRSLTFSRPCAEILLDAGAKLSNVRVGTIVPQWATEFVRVREETRSTAIIILGILKCGGKNANGKDELLMIARCIWSTRGQKINE